MGTAYVYVVRSVGANYLQSAMCNVPCWCGEPDVMYFGPCKKEMRPKVQQGDYIFGISGSGTSPRRVVFIMPVAQRMTFAEAYERFPNLHGPDGSIHVKPRVSGGYEHIPGSMHEDSWESDISPKSRDVFLVGKRSEKANEKERHFVGVWLGPKGPAVRGEILPILQRMSVWKGATQYRSHNEDATETTPVCAGKLYTGLHAEGDEQLLRELLRVCLETLPPNASIPDTSWGHSLRSDSTSRRCCR